MTLLSKRIRELIGLRDSPPDMATDPKTIVPMAVQNWVDQANPQQIGALLRFVDDKQREQEQSDD